MDDTALLSRAEVDELLLELPEVSLAQLLREFEGDASSYDGGPEMARCLADELRLRISAGVRFWPESQIQ